MTLGEVLALGAKTDEGVQMLEDALALHTRKGNLVMIERVGARIEELRATTSID